MAHYVNNKDFLAAIVEMKAKVKHAEENGLPKPIISNYIGECILKIATHLSYKPNFITSSIMKLPISTIGKQKLMSAFFNTSMTLKRFFT